MNFLLGQNCPSTPKVYTIGSHYGSRDDFVKESSSLFPTTLLGFLSLGVVVMEI